MKHLKTFKNIDGSSSAPSKRVGFCKSKLHYGYLTKRLMEEHECLEKECKNFIKYEKNKYWVAEKERQERREEEKEQKKKDISTNKEILAFIKEFTADYDDFAILNTKKNGDDLQIRYVSIGKVDMRPLERCIFDKFEKKVEMIPVKNIDEIKQELIKKYNPKSLGRETIFDDPLVSNDCDCPVNIIKREDIVNEDAEFDDLI